MEVEHLKAWAGFVSPTQADFFQSLYRNQPANSKLNCFDEHLHKSLVQKISMFWQALISFDKPLAKVGTTTTTTTTTEDYLHCCKLYTDVHDTQCCPQNSAKHDVWTFALAVRTETYEIFDNPNPLNPLAGTQPDHISWANSSTWNHHGGHSSVMPCC